MASFLLAPTWGRPQKYICGPSGAQLQHQPQHHRLLRLQLQFDCILTRGSQFLVYRKTISSIWEIQLLLLVAFLLYGSSNASRFPVLDSPASLACQFAVPRTFPLYTVCGSLVSGSFLLQFPASKLFSIIFWLSTVDSRECRNSRAVAQPLHQLQLQLRTRSPLTQLLLIAVQLPLVLFFWFVIIFLPVFPRLLWIFMSYCCYSCGCSCCSSRP